MTEKSRKYKFSGSYLKGWAIPSPTPVFFSRKKNGGLKIHPTSNSCNFLITEPNWKFLVPRLSSSIWNARKWPLELDILSSIHSLVANLKRLWETGSGMLCRGVGEGMDSPFKRSSSLWSATCYDFSVQGSRNFQHCRDFQKAVTLWVFGIR